MGKVCVCSWIYVCVFVYMDLCSIMSLHTWSYAPVHILDASVCTCVCSFVCVELVKECTFD